MSAFVRLLHAWRLLRLRAAFRTLNRRLAAYERAYGVPAVRLTDDDWRACGLARASEA